MEKYGHKIYKKSLNNYTFTEDNLFASLNTLQYYASY